MPFDSAGIPNVLPARRPPPCVARMDGRIRGTCARRAGCFVSCVWLGDLSAGNRWVTERLSAGPSRLTRDHPALHPQNSNEVVLITSGGAGGAAGQPRSARLVE